MKVLLFHDNLRFANTIKKYFKRKDIEIDVLYGYDTILEDIEYLNLFNYNAFVFQIEKDIMEGLDIFEYLKLLKIDVPVLFISDNFSMDLLSIVFARNAEDYIGMPFELKELELRLLKAIRKQNTQDDIYLPNNYVFNYSDSSLSFGHSDVELTTKQQKLLLLLINNKNRAVTYEMIGESVYDGKEFSHNALASHIRDLRKKIKNIPIKSVRGVGYMLKLIESKF